MLLGELIEGLGKETKALDALSALSNPDLLLAAEQAAAADGLPLDAWVRQAVGRFAASADDEQWLGLLTSCRNTSDPGSAALIYMLSVVLKSGQMTGGSGP